MNLSLKQWRTVKGISQEQMAAICDVHRSTYAAWENNPEKISLKYAAIISNALGERLDDVFFNSDVLQNVGAKEGGGNT